MARDGLFFKSVGWLSPRTGAPVVAIVLQGVAATVIALSGRYEQILNYVVSIDFISFALTAASLFVFRHREHSCRIGVRPTSRRAISASSPAANDPAPTIPEPTDNPSTTGSAGIPAGPSRNAAIYRVSGHPYTTALFVLSCAAIVASTICTYPANSVFGFVILLAGIPVYLYWSRKESFLGGRDFSAGVSR